MRNILTLLGVIILFISCSKSSNTNSSNNNPPVHNSDFIVSTYSYGNTPPFNGPTGLAIDGAGNLFIADANNNLIRKISTTGIVSIYAGNGTAGYHDGTALLATFHNPLSLAFDASGNLFVADYSNSVIREITPAGIVSTYAGTGTAGFKDGASTVAEFYSPRAIAFDSSGNLFVSDDVNERIRKITPDGTVSTYAGNGTAGTLNGPALSATFHDPWGIAIDGSGNLYVANDYNNNIRKISSAGIVTSYAGTGFGGAIDGMAASATFNGPTDMAIDALGNLYVADGGNNVIREITTQGVVGTLAGNGGNLLVNGPANNAEFNNPFGIVIDASGNFYIADCGNNAIRKITKQ